MSGKARGTMKKIAFLSVLCVMFVLVLASTAYASEWTEVTGIHLMPEDCWVDSNITTGSDGVQTAAAAKGSNNYHKTLWGISSIHTYTTSAKVSVVRENNDSQSTVYNNIVYKFLDGNNLMLNKVVPDSTVRKYSARVKLSTVEGTAFTGVNLISAGSGNAAVTADAGVYLQGGGAYINDKTSGEKVWFIPEDTMSADAWYTVDTVIDVLKNGYLMQNATVYDANGDIVGRSGFYRVSIKNPNQYNSDGSTYSVAQLYTSGYAATNPVYFDDWKIYKYTGTVTRGSLSFSADTATSRKNYKFVSTVPLDASLIDSTIVTLTADNTRLDMTGKYSASYVSESATSNAIIVTATDALPFDEGFKLKLDTSKMLATDKGYLAFDYSEPTVTDVMTQAFNTGADLFTRGEVAFDASHKPTTITLNNNDAVAREYMIVVSVIDANNKYLQTECVHGTIAAGATAQQIAAPTNVTPVAGGTIYIMVLDNWKDLNTFADVVTHPVPAQ